MGRRIRIVKKYDEGNRKAATGQQYHNPEPPLLRPACQDAPDAQYEEKNKCNCQRSVALTQGPKPPGQRRSRLCFWQRLFVLWREAHGYPLLMTS
jgi:hypothetical protein